VLTSGVLAFSGSSQQAKQDQRLFETFVNGPMREGVT
jgi:hypothetical protein